MKFIKICVWARVRAKLWPRARCRLKRNVPGVIYVLNNAHFFKSTAILERLQPHLIAMTKISWTFLLNVASVNFARQCVRLDWTRQKYFWRCEKRWYPATASIFRGIKPCWIMKNEEYPNDIPIMLCPGNVIRYFFRAAPWREPVPNKPFGFLIISETIFRTLALCWIVAVSRLMILGGITRLKEILAKWSTI